jgi:hypothetical protein
LTDSLMSFRGYKRLFNFSLHTLPLFAILRQAQDDRCHGEPVEPSSLW